MGPMLFLLSAALKGLQTRAYLHENSFWVQARKYNRQPRSYQSVILIRRELLLLAWRNRGLQIPMTELSSVGALLPAAAIREGTIALATAVSIVKISRR